MLNETFFCDFPTLCLCCNELTFVSLSLGRPWRHILSQFHSDDEKHRANSELHIKKAFACTISVETSSHRSLLYMIDTSMEWRAALKESQGKKTVAHMLSISHHITLMILATLLLSNYYSKSSFLALVTSKYIHLHYSDTSKSYKWELSSYIGNHSIHENVSISSCQMFK